MTGLAWQDRAAEMEKQVLRQELEAALVAKE
jgi:hypothetical protein